MLSQRGKNNNSKQLWARIGDRMSSHFSAAIQEARIQCNDFPCRVLYPSHLRMIKSEGRMETLWTCKITNLPPMHPFEEATEGCSPSKQENKPIKMKTWIQKTGNPKQKMKKISCLRREKPRWLFATSLENKQFRLNRRMEDSRKDVAEKKRDW